MPVALLLTLSAGCGQDVVVEIQAPVEATPNAAATSTPEGAATIALEGTTYGAGITLAEPIALSDLLANGYEYADQRVRVEGTVVDVCPSRGCWFDIAGDEEFQSIRFKVVDGVMTFPMEMQGKYAVAEGTVKLIEWTLEETRDYYAQDAAERGETFDPESVTEPAAYLQLDGLGAVVRDAR